MSTRKITRDTVLLEEKNDIKIKEFDIPVGGFTIVSGPSGSGKSYFVKYEATHWGNKMGFPAILADFKSFGILSPEGKIYPLQISEQHFEAFMEDLDRKVSRLHGDNILIILDEPSPFYETDTWKSFFHKYVYDNNITLIISTQYPDLLTESDLEIEMGGIKVIGRN